MEARIRLIGKPDCHLCDDARNVVESVATEMNVTWVEVSILDDPVLADQYWLEIPVVEVDGNRVSFWRITPEQLRAAL